MQEILYISIGSNLRHSTTQNATSSQLLQYVQKCVLQIFGYRPKQTKNSE